jgi:hypothetical protein
MQPCHTQHRAPRTGHRTQAPPPRVITSRRSYLPPWDGRQRVFRDHHAVLHGGGRPPHDVTGHRVRACDGILSSVFVGVAHYRDYLDGEDRPLQQPPRRAHRVGGRRRPRAVPPVGVPLRPGAEVGNCHHASIQTPLSLSARLSARLPAHGAVRVSIALLAVQKKESVVPTGFGTVRHLVHQVEGGGVLEHALHCQPRPEHVRRRGARCRRVGAQRRPVPPQP